MRPGGRAREEEEEEQGEYMGARWRKHDHPEINAKYGDVHEKMKQKSVGAIEMLFPRGSLHRKLAKVGMVTGVLLVIPEMRSHRWTWYWNGLWFGGIYGRPDVVDDGPDGEWSTKLAIQVRMTAAVYIAFVVAGVASAFLQPLIAYGRRPGKGTSGAKNTRTIHHLFYPSTYMRWLVSQQCLDYLLSLIVATAAVRAVVHSLVAWQLLPTPYSDDAEYFRAQLNYMKANANKEPPSERFAEFAAQPRCNSLVEREHIDMCAKDDEKGGSPSTRSPDDGDVCSQPPCPDGTIIDSNAMGGPLNAFRKVVPMPTFTASFPYADMWRSFYDFPVVIRNAVRLPLETPVKMSNGRRVNDTAITHSIIDARRLGELCKDEMDDSYMGGLAVGYRFRSPRHRKVSSTFAGLYTIQSMPMRDFYRLNVERTCDKESYANVTADETAFRRMDSRLADIRIFTEQEGKTEEELQSVLSITNKDGELQNVTLQELLQDNLDRTSNRRYREIIAKEVDDLEYNLTSNDPSQCRKGYVFDDSVMESCSKLLNEIPFPRYAQDDARMVDHDNSFGMASGTSWPSWFLGNGGIKSEVHQDALGTSFFLMVASGRKLFRVVRAEEAHYFAEHDLMQPNKTIVKSEAQEDPWYFYTRLVQPKLNADAAHTEDTTTASADASADADTDTFQLFAPSESWRRHSSNFTVYETVLEAGDILYIPRWGLHGAINLAEETVSVSANWMHLSLHGLYRDLCSSEAFKDSFAAGPYCNWAGLHQLRRKGNLNTYGQSLWMGYRLLTTKFRIHILGRFAETWRSLTRRFIQYGQATYMHPGGWQFFFGWNSPSTPPECACCCDVYFDTGSATDKVRFTSGSLAWLQPLDARPSVKCALSFFTSLGIESFEIKSRMEACMQRLLWERYTVLGTYGACPAIIVLVLSLVQLARDRLGARGQALLIKKE